MKVFTVSYAEQRSPAWKAARCGRLTASRAKDMLATIKSGEAAARRDLRTQLVLERLTGEPQDDVNPTADMQRGVMLERAARSAYEALTGRVADECGFVAHEQYPIGCSPDGILDDFDGIVELKCPKSATHLAYLRAGGVPPEYQPQLLHSLWVTDAGYVDFLSYDPRFPDGMQTFYTRFVRDEDAVQAYAKKALAFLAEVDAEVAAIRTSSNLPRTLSVA